MKKENIIGILIYLLVFAVAVIYGFTVLQTHFANSGFKEVWQYALYIIVSVLAGVFAAGVLSELGHLLGAKTGGYKIVSWCLLYFTVYLDKNGKRKVKFANFDGLTGETKIIPNYEKKETPNPYPYLLYGEIFNLAWIVACIFLFITYQKNKGFESDMGYFFLTCSIIAALILMYNVVPTKLDSVTDGYRLSQIKKDVPGFNDKLAAEYGGDLPETIMVKKEEETSKKPAKFIPEVALNQVCSLLVEKNYDEAFKLLDEINEHEKECTNKVLFEAKSQHIFATIMSKSDSDAYDYYEKEVPFALRRELSNETSLPIIRTYLLTAGLLDGSQSEVMLSLNKVLKAYKNVPANRRHNELVLFNETLDKLIEAHPKWEDLPNYKLYE